MSQPDVITTDDGVSLSLEQAGTGTPIVLLHGLTATSRYVLMGSRLLERSGLRVVSYDARGHGRSTPAPEPRTYGYDRLARDLLAVLDSLELDRAILAGASMGAHTIVRFTLDHPERVAGIGLITPAYDPALHAATPDAFVEWDALAHGLRKGGVEGFLAAYDFASVREQWRATVETVVRQRLSAHEHPAAVADALEVVPRSRPFRDMDELAAIAVPTVVIASRDEADPSHPLAIGERYAQAIADASLVVEGAGVGGHPVRSPIAWQGGQLSRVLLQLAPQVS
jgi:pimeloyl-ACP methyl ester carboxylesterase